MSRITALAVGLLAIASAATACARNEETKTTAELLAEIEGRELTPAELAQREQVAALLCDLDESVLVEVWNQLEPDQLPFQDFVFSRECPERNALYGEATGRFVSDTES